MSSPQARPERPKFIVVLQPLPSVADPIRALRAALKRLLRDHKLKAVSVEEVPRDSTPFNAADDIWESVGEAYRVIRERKANGGSGWPRDPGGES